ncbi:hypothetical protein ACLBO4_29840, partial [Klebsiella pneumoniae]
MFFDLDGTLHQQDMFGSFLRYLLRHLPLNLLLRKARGLPRANRAAAADA